MVSNNEAQRVIQKLASIAESMDRLVKVGETFNKNFVAFAQDFNKDVDLDQLAEEVDRLREIKKGADEIRPFDLRDKVRVIDENTIMHGKVGIVVMTAPDGTVEVDFDDGKTGAEYSAHQLEKVVEPDNSPHEDAMGRPCGGPEYCVVCREPSESYTQVSQYDGKKILERFIPDVAGRLYPNEWRHNLEINDIRVMKPDSPKLRRNENRPKTRAEFDMYNTELYATGVIMNEIDAEGTPDARGRLKPYEWRHKLGMDAYTGDTQAFDECRLMTEESFRIYNAGLMMGGTTAEQAGENLKASLPQVYKTDAQGRKADAHEVLDEKWKGDF